MYIAARRGRSLIVRDRELHVRSRYIRHPQKEKVDI